MGDLYDKHKWNDREKLDLLTETARLVVGILLTVAVVFVFPLVVQVVGDSIKWAVVHFPYGV